tara:strand:+ start:367 stop:1062 length:696 start_codon:yes stop_codon:yes gene_type:complete
MCVGSPEPKEDAVKDSSDKLPTNLKAGFVERDEQPRMSETGFYEQERGRGNVAEKSTGVRQATATSPRERPSTPEMRDLAIRNIEKRIDERSDTVNPLVPGGNVLNVVNAVGNFFAERMIAGLKGGQDPVYGSSGDVIGTRDPDSGRLMEGRDDLTVDGVSYNTIAEANRARNEKERRESDPDQEPETRDRDTESATNPLPPDSNRRSMLALRQAKSAQASAGSGRRGTGL